MRTLKNLIRNNSGSATIEFVLWVPWFALLLMATVDASFMYMSLTRMENTARDAARRVSTGEFSTAEIVPFILDQMPGDDFAVNTACSTADFACIVISRPVNSMTPFGVFASLVGETFGAEVKMRLEPGVTLTWLTDVELTSHG